MNVFGSGKLLIALKRRHTLQEIVALFSLLFSDSVNKPSFILDENERKGDIAVECVENFMRYSN